MATVSEIIGVLRLRGGNEFAREIKYKAAQVRDSFLTIQNAVAGAGLVFFLRNVNDVANRAQNAMLGLQSVASFKGIQGAEAAAQQLDAVRAGLMSSFDAAAALKNLLSRGYDLSAAVSTLNALSNSAAFGRAAHLSLGEAVVTATEGLKNENSILVDNAGVTKNISVIWAEYAKQIGVGVNSLTQEQKIQAEVNGILRETQAQMGDLTKLANSEAGAQARLAAAREKSSVTLGKMVQQVSAPFIQMLTDMIEKFNQAPTVMQNFTVALGATTTALYLFGGGISALLGPWGLAITAITLFISLLEKLSGRTDLDVDGLKKFGTELQKLSTAQAAARLANLQTQLEKVNQTLANPVNRTDRVIFTQWLQRKNLLLEEIKLTQEFIGVKKELEKPKAVQDGVLTSAGAPSEKEIDAAKERLDNQRRFEFEHQQISREQYLAYLQTRQQDFTKWDNDWLAAQQEILKLKEFYSADELKKAGDLGTAILEVYRKQDEETRKHHQTNFENSQAALDRQAQFEFESNEIGSEQYLNYLRSRLDDYQAWSEEWLGIKRHIVQVEKDIDQKKKDDDKAIWQQQRDQALAIAQDISSGVAAIGLAMADSMRTGGNAFKAFWKSMLTTALEAIERYFLLAKIKSIIEAAVNPLAALKNAAPLIIASGLLQVAKAQIAALATGTVIKKPTVALLGEAGQPEIVAPERDFMSYSNQLVDQALRERPKRNELIQPPQALRADGQAPDDMRQQTRPEVRRALPNLKTVFDVAVKPLVALKSLAPVVLNAGMLQGFREEMAALAENLMGPQAALAGIGLPPARAFEFQAPQPREDVRNNVAASFGRTRQEVEASDFRSRREAVNMTLNFNTPLNDRRTAEQLTEQVLKPEVRREVRKRRRVSNELVVSER